MRLLLLMCFHGYHCDVNRPLSTPGSVSLLCFWMAPTTDVVDSASPHVEAAKTEEAQSSFPEADLICRTNSLKEAIMCNQG